MIYISVTMFLACWHGMPVTEMSEQERVQICFSKSICIGTEASCSKETGKIEGELK